MMEETGYNDQANVTILTPDQLRAARALANVSQHELARRSGISRNALNNFERHKACPRVETLKILKQTLALYGVECLENEGVRKTAERFDVERFEGTGYLRRLNDDIRSRIESGDCTSSYMSGIDNRRFGAEELQHIEDMRWFEFTKAHNIDERVLVREGMSFFITEKNIYRCLPPEVASEVPYAVYGDTLAIIVWGPPVRLMFIRNPSIAETFRRQFLIQWDMARPLTPEEYAKGVDTARRALMTES